MVLDVGLSFLLSPIVFVLCLSDNLGLCSGHIKCYLVRLNPGTSLVVLTCLGFFVLFFFCFVFVPVQWMLSGCNHML